MVMNDRAEVGDKFGALRCRFVGRAMLMMRSHQQHRNNVTDRKK